MWFWPKKKPKQAAEAKLEQGGAIAKREAPEGKGGALSREVAAVTGDLYEPLLGWLGVRPNRDPLLSHQQPGADYAYPYGLLEEALDKDAHLSALITQRKAAVLSWEREVVPADGSPAALQAASVVEQALTNIGTGNAVRGGDGGFEHDLAELLDAIPYGLAVSEIMWEQKQSAASYQLSDSGTEHRTDGWQLKADSLLLPKALLSRHPRRFVFAAGGDLRLLSKAEPVKGEALPARKFIVFAPYSRHENPYGLPQLRSVWWLAYFKRQVLKFWVMYCEKFGTPTAVLRHPLSASEREKRAYRRIIGSIQQETGLVVPEGVELELLEAQRAGSALTYRELIEFANREMSKALVGQTLTTESDGRGSYALGQVHHAVREDIVRQDAQALMALVNTQLVRWIVDLNFPPSQRKYPRWRLHPPREDDLKLQLEIDRFFAGQGLPLDEAELYARYGRSASDGGVGAGHRPRPDVVTPATKGGHSGPPLQEGNQ